MMYYIVLCRFTIKALVLTKDAKWLAFCQSSMKHFEKAFALRYILLTRFPFSLAITPNWSPPHFMFHPKQLAPLTQYMND